MPSSPGPFEGGTSEQGPPAKKSKFGNILDEVDLSPRPKDGLVSARLEWDKRTFRVSRVPQEFSHDDLSQVIELVLGLGESDFRIHSFASDAVYDGDPRWKTATISFRTRPDRLAESLKETDKWRFPLKPKSRGFSTPNDEATYIYFDSHFHGFTPLSPIQDDDKHKIDCILVHGWGGHPLGSFQSSSSTHVWPRDDLPRHFPQLRVWMYGYHSKLADTVIVEDVYGYAETFSTQLSILRQKIKPHSGPWPIIFLVHGLGGWIFKDAMVSLNNSSEADDRLIVQSTYGALFFGVPGQGMNVEAMASMVKGRAAQLTLGLLDQQRAFRLRGRQQEEFCKAFPYLDSKIVQFFETKESPTVVQDTDTGHWTCKGKTALLVNPDSATCGRGWEKGFGYQFSLTGNHTSMIKFEDNDNDYGTVREVMRKFVQLAGTVIERRLQLQTEKLSNHLDDLTPAEKGKPGAGKSTLLKHTLRLAEDERTGNSITIAFFFHGRGMALQRNPLGLWRSMLHQILCQLPELLRGFTRILKERRAFEVPSAETWEWRETELKEHVRTLAETAASAHNVHIYIDALDECGENAALELSRREI